MPGFKARKREKALFRVENWAAAQWNGWRLRWTVYAWPADRRSSNPRLQMSSPADLAVEAAYQQHGPGLVSHLTWVTHDRDLAEDLAHDAFIRLDGQIRAGRTPDNVAAWLHRVALNLATSHARHAQVAHRRESALPRPDQPRSPESIVVGGELVEQIHGLVRELSVPERHAVLLAADGVPGSEIARAIGRTPAAARTLLCRARAKLRAGMGGVAEAVA